MMDNIGAFIIRFLAVYPLIFLALTIILIL